MSRISPDGRPAPTADEAPREHCSADSGPGETRREPRNQCAKPDAIACGSRAPRFPGGSRGSIAGRHDASDSSIPAQASRAKYPSDREVPVRSPPQWDEELPPRTSTPRCQRFLPVSQSAPHSNRDQDPLSRFSNEATAHLSAPTGRILGRGQSSPAKMKRVHPARGEPVQPTCPSRHHFPDAARWPNPSLAPDDGLVDLLPAALDRLLGAFDQETMEVTDVALGNRMQRGGKFRLV